MMKKKHFLYREASAGYRIKIGGANQRDEKNKLNKRNCTCYKVTTV